MAVREYYDADPVVERYIERARLGLFDHERDLLDRHFRDRKADVLDVGCGTGRTTEPLAERGFGVVGVDVSESLIEVARDLNPDLEFRVGDATGLDFPDESFEYVLFAGRGMDDIRPAADRMRAILEAWRVLKPGGVFAFDANNVVNRYLFDPRSSAGWASIARFLARNAAARRLTSRYAYIEFPAGVDLAHAITPRAQRRQLEDVGFEVEEVVQSPAARSRPVHLDPRPYYVARKPTSSP